MALKRPTFLVADDQPAILGLTVSLLQKLPDDPFIFRARNGKMAWEIALENEPDVIVMDWEMPVMDGIEATRRISANPGTAGTPIIMFTAQRTSPDNLRMALEAGATDFIRKPAEATELHARVSAALRLSRATRAITLHNQELERINADLMAALDQVQTLSSLLQMCAHCRRIRDDDGGWVPLERYIVTNTRSDFSHGLCEACLVEHYPDLAHD